MSLYKIIVCIVLAVVSLYVGFLHEDIRELKGNANKKEKRAIDILEIIAFCLPLTVIGVMAAE